MLWITLGFLTCKKNRFFKREVLQCIWNSHLWDLRLRHCCIHEKIERKFIQTQYLKKKDRTRKIIRSRKYPIGLEEKRLSRFSPKLKALKSVDLSNISWICFPSFWSMKFACSNIFSLLGRYIKFRQVWKSVRSYWFCIQYTR